jgi:choline transport protein
MSTDIMTEKLGAEETPITDRNAGDVVNASGHKQELQRNFGLLSICAIAVTTGNTWIAQGGSVVSIKTSSTSHAMLQLLIKDFGRLST